MLLLIGMIIGLVLGLTGAGGSVFAVPLLMLMAGMPMTDAVGISLGAVAASTLYGSLRNLLQKNAAPVLWKPGIILASAGAVSAPIGKWLGLQLNELWLLTGFTLLAGVIALRMWISANKNPAAASVVRAGNFADTPSPGLICRMSQTGQFELRPRCVSGLLIGGLFVGLLSGLFGVGGGFLIVPLLLALSAVSMSQAVSTSLMMIALISSSGFISHLLLGTSHELTASSHWVTLGLVAIGGVAGMVIGQAVSHKIANALLQKIFAASLIIVCIITLVRSFL
ncbi:sulfite exporter TauE/SafE family protein [Cellvibrio sp. OA-2007]|uniref:sulfite exporter TauE/SafE family protein n=1 Tax=Cellvibrio sp. OA-2007 TaxID=529823 RepID=UPI0007801F57|nr:sulfite exporter TauE/SafE family protein [Cellvibrio sp. OA-2007]